MGLILRGRWTAGRAVHVERVVAEAAQQSSEARRVILDLSSIERLDTLGALVIDRMIKDLGQHGRTVTTQGARPEYQALLKEVAAHHAAPPAPRVSPSPFVDFLSDVGAVVVGAGKDLAAGTAFLGEVVAAFVRVARHPGRFRITSVVHQIEQIALRGAPIIILISFLVGCIVAQQGIFQLQRFGATAFVVNLVGILVLRELGVLLTSIMVAGRSGSAFTAEIGSMKMREEIDALKVMGLDPVEVLILPRILALVISLPLLTFLSDISALIGGAMVSWAYGDISPDVFVQRLRSAVQSNTVLVGIIKAPFMALVIGVIACMEGLAVKGSAESLGQRVTASVVKAIFMVIVLDGVFAVFFAAIKY